MEQKNILFTCAGRRNYLINYFKEALKGNGFIIATDMQANAAALIDADISITVPNIYSNLYISTLKNICIEYKVDAVISLNDLELPILSKHKNELEKNGTKVIISDELAIDISFDKWKTYEFLTSINLLTPKTYLDLNIVLKDLESNELNFPLVLKPRWGSSSIGVDIVQNIEELELAYKLLKIKLSRSTLNQENINKAIIIQQKIGGTEFGMDVLNNFNGNYYGTFVREKLSMRFGETDKAKSVINAEISKVGEVISKNLHHFGNLDCDVFIEENNIYVLELNPRFGGGYPFSHEAGINIAAIYIEWIKGGNNIDKYNNYKDNISFSKCDRLIKIPS
ncbi:ATP-dependent carboxylate-amine ligase [Pseudalgibacter alginicilyticus]|uniref:ATP-dependent carboxylate-amine ligase n=1 Tax=Pseudalgibacter alginicilyticus TaxID=1736674 RepID=A0A0N7HYA9_9FLAO|nr:ATP-grasp domain-containing protein [Pseudalgibacter alginicilyticus]ALJ04742.1 ATP-dependent carboxylate-amine ligase [Pseudalgibacter alginicilyticus]